jgi:3-oxoacyl-[acyl-carrier protein] reductase
MALRDRAMPQDAAEREAERPLSGRVALVTGGSRGIGAAICRRLAGAGAAVAVGYQHRADAAGEVVEGISRQGGRALAVGGDVSRPEAIRDLVERTVRELGPVDVLVANAGILREQATEEVTPADWDEVLAVNLGSAFWCAQTVLPGMRERRWGRILLMSSLAAFVGGFVGPHYAASKAGMLGLMHYLASTTAGDGVTVNALAPGLIETDMLRLDDRSGRRDRPLPTVPVGRLGRPEEVADLALAAVTNGYLTNQAIVVDGGRHPR